MKTIESFEVKDAEAALWFLGQAGYILRSAGVTVVIDPYLSDSARSSNGEFARLLPVPIPPEELRADYFLVTHDHLDHLDPETIRQYRHAATTRFIAPRLAVRKLREIGVPAGSITRLDVGESISLNGLTVRGVFTLPTGADVLDTTGFLLTFANGRSVYHTSDTAFTPLLLAAAPRKPEVMFVPINGKWGNLNVEQAVELTAAVVPHFVMPNHYDMMALNAEHPETFRWFCENRKLPSRCVIPKVMQPFTWTNS